MKPKRYSHSIKLALLAALILQISHQFTFEDSLLKTLENQIYQQFNSTSYQFNNCDLNYYQQQISKYIPESLSEIIDDNYAVILATFNSTNFGKDLTKKPNQLSEEEDQYCRLLAFMNEIREQELYMSGKKHPVLRFDIREAHQIQDKKLRLALATKANRIYYIEKQKVSEYLGIHDIHHFLHFVQRVEKPFVQLYNSVKFLDYKKLFVDLMAKCTEEIDQQEYQNLPIKTRIIFVLYNKEDNHSTYKNQLIQIAQLFKNREDVRIGLIDSIEGVLGLRKEMKSLNKQLDLLINEDGEVLQNFILIIGDGVQKSTNQKSIRKRTQQLNYWAYM